jgi:hypothetical protein
MNTETQKLELIQWLAQLQDAIVLQKLMEIKQSEQKIATQKRQRGTGKGIFTYIADDFNEPLDIFDEYTKK